MSELTFQDPKKKFCEQLQEARKAKNLDISRIAEKSKIAQNYLERIEAGEWDFLPHAYVRAFLRTYVQILGLNVDEVLQQFDDITDEPPVPIPGRGFEEDRPPERRGEKKQTKIRRKKLEDVGEEESVRAPLKFSLAGDSPTAEASRKAVPEESSGNPLLWVGGLIIAAMIVAALLFWPREETTSNVEEIPFDEVVKEHEEMVADEPETPTDEGIAQAQDEIATQGAQLEEEVVEELTLVTQAVQRCYIRITADRDSIPLDDIVLEPGMSRTYFADSLFTVVIGNAAGMKLILDGLDLGELGEEGRVVTAIIGPDGLRRLRLGVLRPPRRTQEDNADTVKPQPIPEEQLMPQTRRGRTQQAPVTTPSEPDTTQPDSL